MSDTFNIKNTLVTISKSYEDCPFIQTQLIDTSTFISYLRDRGLSFSRDTLRKFNEILPPVYSYESRDYYHPYQAWVACQLIRVSELHLDWSSWWMGSPEFLSTYVQDHQSKLGTNLDTLKPRILEFYTLLNLLVSSDPYTIPIIRRKLSLSLFKETKGSYEKYITWRQSFNGNVLISESKLSPAMIKQWHQSLSISAGLMNEAEDWYLLMRHASYEKRNKFKNKLKLAFDFYEMAESLRILLISAGEKVIAEDDYLGSGSYWKKGFYGVDEINFATRIVLKRLLREYDLDASYKLFWFVEGPTEKGFIEFFSESTGINIEERGIALINLGGTGDLTARRKEVGKKLSGAQSFVETLRALKTEEVSTFITADDDGGISEALESLRHQELVTAGFNKWAGDFEEGNFSISELICVLQNVSDQPITITVEEIAEAKSKLNGAGNQIALERQSKQSPE